MLKLKMFLGMILVTGSMSVFADVKKGIYFSHHDWEISCDNTKTCRAAGYNADSQGGDDQIASVLLTRKAGVTEVKGQVTLDVFFYEEEATLPKKVQMWIDDVYYGDVMFSNTRYAVLSAKQVQAILSDIQKNRKIEFRAKNHIWHISDKGLSAVLLKMDEVQQRVGTPSALVTKGNKANPTQRYTMPVLHDKPILGYTETIKYNSEKGKQLISILRKTNLNDSNGNSIHESCFDVDEIKDDFTVISLSNTQKLVGTSCWRGAYNQGDAVWIMDQHLRQIKEIITTDATEYVDKNQIFAIHKGRGIGDCFSMETWTWNGAKFVKTLEQTTGMCRGFMGGAWDLPTLQIDVATIKDDLKAF